MDERILAVVMATQALLFALSFRSERRAARNLADSTEEAERTKAWARAGYAAMRGAQKAERRAETYVAYLTADRTGRESDRSAR